MNVLKIQIIKILQEGYINPKGSTSFYRVKVVEDCWGNIRVNDLDYPTKEDFEEDRERGYYYG